MERLRNCGGSLTIPCKGSLIVPSGNIDTLPLLNEFNLDPRRLTTAQSPLGGVNGLVDYAPGSVHVTEGDGIYLTDVAGNNTSKDLPAGLLSRLGYLTIDTVAHTITEEFIVSNTATSNNPTVVDTCNSTTGWNIVSGTGVLTTVSGYLNFAGTSSATGVFDIQRGSIPNLTNYKFICFDIKSSLAGNLRLIMWDGTSATEFRTSRFPIAVNTWTHFVVPILAPSGAIGQNPSFKAGTLNIAAITGFSIGIDNVTASAACTLYVDNITADVAKSAYIETATPDNITSVVYQIWNGSTYNTNYMANMDPFSFIFSDPTQMVLNDGTKFDDVYGSSLGRSLFAKGASGQTVNGSLTGTTMTYSAVRGTKNRIGFRVDLPPSDGGRTAFNQCRIKKIIYYTDVNKASNVLPDVSGNGNNGTMSQVGLTADNMGNPYGAMSFNGVNSFVDCGTNSALHFSNSFTVSAVVKMPSAPLVDQCLIVSDYRGAYKGYEIYINATRNVRFRVGRQSTSSINSVSSSQTLSLDTYYTITGVYDGIKSCVYVNGAVTNGPDFSPIEAENGPTYIGKAGWGSLYYTGIATNIRLYSRALSAEEVTALYNNQPVSSTGLVAQWQPSTVSHMGQSTQEFSNDNNASTGLLNISKPWLAIIDPATKQLDYYLFTERPISLNYKRDESWNVYEVVVNPGNGLVYKGSTVWANNTLDTNSDSKPDMLDATIQNSIAQMLSVYAFNR